MLTHLFKTFGMGGQKASVKLYFPGLIITLGANLVIFL
jgi:hypothetical protein